MNLRNMILNGLTLVKQIGNDVASLQYYDMDSGVVRRCTVSHGTNIMFEFFGETNIFAINVVSIKAIVYPDSWFVIVTNEDKSNLKICVDVNNTVKVYYEPDNATDSFSIDLGNSDFNNPKEFVDTIVEWLSYGGVNETVEYEEKVKKSRRTKNN